MTPSFRNPWLWLRRFRHRCGYGVHSPFAFRLLEDVVYERLPYYAFRDLDRLLTFREHFRVRRYLHLLFRLTNYHHPTHILHSHAAPLEKMYIAAARPSAQMQPLGNAECRMQNAECRMLNAELKNSTRGEANNSAFCNLHSAFPHSTLLFLGRPDDACLPLLTPSTMLLLANVHLHRQWWDSLPKVVSFDLYDLGIAFFNPKYHPHEYIVNF